MTHILQVGVKIFLTNKEGKILLLKRNGEKYKDIQNVWDIAGGRIEAGTTLMENLRREVREETGLIITSDPVLLCAQDIFFDNTHVVRLSYRGMTEGEPTLDGVEHTEYVWLSLEELKTLEGVDVRVQEIIQKRLLESRDL